MCCASLNSFHSLSCAPSCPSLRNLAFVKPTIATPPGLSTRHTCGSSTAARRARAEEKREGGGGARAQRASGRAARAVAGRFRASAAAAAAAARLAEELARAREELDGVGHDDRVEGVVDGRLGLRSRTPLVEPPFAAR